MLSTYIFRWGKPETQFKPESLPFHSCSRICNLRSHILIIYVFPCPQRHPFASACLLIHSEQLQRDKFSELWAVCFGIEDTSPPLGCDLLWQVFVWRIIYPCWVMATASHWHPVGTHKLLLWSSVWQPLKASECVCHLCAQGSPSRHFHQFQEDTGVRGHQQVPAVLS